ncbi:hypothetical protein NE237_023186 [Protea cynaroides]|uniref:MACPF domain-containing protein n=1 Tax=Protea cynaroides TaxID=273540 RepID=A0A9Q0HB93_9MAGN|nr:hypothetical protein NE237_023186 [Protea cynaroides]
MALGLEASEGAPGSYPIPPHFELEGAPALESFNSIFSFTSKQIDAASSKNLAVDGFFISLCEVQLTKSPLVLHGKVKQAIPSSWDTSALARFIENFGTHVITSVTIGGKDVIYIKQHHSSPSSNMEIKNMLRTLEIKGSPILEAMQVQVQ